MGFWTLFEVASMPVLQVLIISLLGAYMATEYCNLLPSGARRSLNRVCCFKLKYNSARFRLILKVCWVQFANADCVCGVYTFPHVCKCGQDCHIWWHHFLVCYILIKLSHFLEFFGFMRFDHPFSGGLWLSMWDLHFCLDPFLDG